MASRLSRGNIPLHDGVCFHCQQCAEKYLKGLLEELGHTPPRTHNLDDILSLLRPTCPTLRPFRRGLIFLSHYAVETRYPGDDATKRQATAALRWMERVRGEGRKLLGIRPPRKGPQPSP